ncbi:hypothetical protein HC931_08305 [Candidatus Gracilibacteria bacterium]|nr:hypothetical protein [Candidatus Gracilibacteria bacterium]
MNNDLELQSSLAQNELKLFCTINNSKISLLDSKPRISWNAVEDAISYLVIMMKDSKKYWQQEVKGLEIARADIPPLQLGSLYKVIIKVNMAISSPEISDRRAFIVLDRESVKILQEFENLDENTKTIAQTSCKQKETRSRLDKTV